MPKNLTGSVGSFPTQTAPVAGEARTAGGIELAFQQSADRSEYVKDRVLHVDPTREGARRLRRVASLGVLQTLSDRPQSTIVQVDGVGIYQFDATSELEELFPLVIKPNDVTHPAPGRWIVHGYGMLDIENGIPKLDANGKVRVAQLDGSVGGKLGGSSIARGLISQAFMNTDGSFTVAADNTWRDVTSCQLSTNSDVLAGDTLSVTFTVKINPVQGDQAFLRVQVVRPNATTQEFEWGHWAGHLLAAPEGPMVTLTKHTPAPQNGVYIVRLQAKGSSSNTQTFDVTKFNGRLDVYRA